VFLRQWAGFHRLVVIARRFQPGVFLICIQEFIRRLRSGILWIGYTLRRMLPYLVAIRVLVPGSRNILSYIVGSSGSTVERSRPRTIPRGKEKPDALFVLSPE
jgi:hypothetical protein